MIKTIFHRFPALSENAVLRYIAFSALYFAQGIPEGLVVFGLPAWMAMYGISTAEIGTYVAISLIPWSFKIVAAPLMVNQLTPVKKPIPVEHFKDHQ